MKLVDNAKSVWKHWSTWALATIVNVGGGWMLVPDSLKDKLPTIVGQVVAGTVFVVAVLGLAAKHVDQDNLAPKDPQ